MKRILSTALILMLLIAVSASSSLAQEGDVIDTLTESGNFGTLLTALNTAELTDVLRADASPAITVFAPTDDAFAALPEGTLDTLLADPTGQLTEVLLAHVINGVEDSTALSGMTTVVTAGGQELAIGFEGGSLTIGGAEVILADITASNGVIHVIDAVIVPSSGEAEPVTIPDSGAERSTYLIMLALGIFLLLGGAMMAKRANIFAVR